VTHEASCGGDAYEKWRKIVVPCTPRMFQTVRNLRPTVASAWGSPPTRSSRHRVTRGDTDSKREGEMTTRMTSAEVPHAPRP
jgi:hypothetical protein